MLSTGHDPRLCSAFDAIFASYTRGRHLARARFDRDFRKPRLTIDALDALGLLPDPSRVILVSGSKGKGTVARQVAWNLAHASGGRVGLVVSPEELGHLDRIRIDGVPIPADDFVRILDALQPAIRAMDAIPDHYVPPTAIFLMIALAWFRERAVDRMVLEGGRGVAYDEIGHIAAGLGIVTSVFGEHLDRLGPTVQDIANDKLALLRNCTRVIAGPTVAPYVAGSPWHERRDALTLVGVPTADAGAPAPAWVRELAAIGRAALQQIDPAAPWRDFGTPAFFVHVAEGLEFLCDGAIVPDSIDAVFLRERGLAAGCAVVGLTDGKDAAGIVQRLRTLGLENVLGVRLRSPIGHVDSAWLDQAGLTVIDTVDVVAPDASRLRRALLAAGHRHGGPVYVAGVQLFIRSVRQAFDLPVYAPTLPVRSER